jgi:hypothetical protein
MSDAIVAARNTILVALVILTALIALAAARAYPTTDLFCFLTASRLVTEGGDPYDAATWSVATAGTFPDYRGVPRATPCPGRFGYPLWTALALVPLTWLGLAAPIAWQVLLFAGMAIGSRTLAGAAGHADRGAALALVVVASQPFWLTVLNAQFGGILLASLGISAALLARRPTPAGVALAAGLLKPHVVALVLVLLPLRELRRGRPRIAVVLLGASALATALSLAVRPSWPSEYLTELIENRSDQTAAATSLVGLSSFFTGSPLAGAVLAAAVLAVTLLLLRRRSLDGTELIAAAAAASQVASPYLGSHDELLLAPAWAFILRAGPAGPMLAAIVAVALPWAAYLSKTVLGNGEGLSGLVPAVTLVALALVLRARPQGYAPPMLVRAIPT